MLWWKQTECGPAEPPVTEGLKLTWAHTDNTSCVLDRQMALKTHNRACSLIEQKKKKIRYLHMEPRHIHAHTCSESHRISHHMMLIWKGGGGGSHELSLIHANTCSSSHTYSWSLTPFTKRHAHWWSATYFCHYQVHAHTNHTQKLKLACQFSQDLWPSDKHLSQFYSAPVCSGIYWKHATVWFASLVMISNSILQFARLHLMLFSLL